MILPIENARKGFSKAPLLVPLVNAMALAVFLCGLFLNEIEAGMIFALICVASGIGLCFGIYDAYRSELLGSARALFSLGYVIVGFEIMTFGSAWPIATDLAGRSDLKFLAFLMHMFCVLLSVLGGMYQEARCLGWRPGVAVGWWREELNQHVDYDRQLVSPSLTKQPSSRFDSAKPYLILGLGLNIPLLFALYGGGRANAAYLAAPLGTMAAIYLNVRYLGPPLLRLLLLRKLEKEVGYRFQNADYEQIQELRRSFFLARWLMKDYRPPMPCVDAESSVTPSRQEAKKRKRRR